VVCHALALSKKLNGPVGIKKFDVDRDLPNYFDEFEKVVTFADTNFVVDEQFIETCLHALPDNGASDAWSTVKHAASSVSDLVK